jgi:hypothetical protein
MKNSSDTIGNRTGDLPACSAVPKPTAPPRIPVITSFQTQNNLNSRFHRHRLRLHELPFVLVNLVKIFIKINFAPPTSLPVYARWGRSVGIVIRLRIKGLRSRRSMPGMGKCSSRKLGGGSGDHPRYQGLFSGEDSRVACR